MKDDLRGVFSRLHEVNKSAAPSLSPSEYWAIECKKKVWPTFSETGSSLRLVDLFSGCGGLTLGAYIATVQLGLRLDIALAADIWKDALDVYKANFGPFISNERAMDLSSLVVEPGSLQLSSHGRELTSKLGDVDVVVAGPPCQGHSNLNNSSRRNDPRNLLYTVPIAVGMEAHAKFICIENVPAVVHSDVGVVNSALAALSERGYKTYELLANAQNFGLPQTRKRHILIASRLHTAEKLECVLDVVQERLADVPLWPFIEDLEFEPESEENLMTKRSRISADNIRRIHYLFDSDSHVLPNAMRPPCHRDKEHSYISMYGRLSRDLPAQTITSGFGSMGQGRFVHPTQRRLITAHEAARIQGFPDYFSFASVAKLSSLREMIGNAVAPPVAAVLLKLLWESVERN